MLVQAIPYCLFVLLAIALRWLPFHVFAVILFALLLLPITYHFLP